MRADSDFVGTIVRLMRLTHQRKLEWYREASASDSPFVMLGGDTFTPTYTAEIKNLHFSLEDVSKRSEFGKTFDHKDNVHSDILKGVLGSDISFGKAPRYRLVITDQINDEVIVSPPLQAVDDLAAIVRGYDEEKLEEINRRLDAEL